MAFWHGYPRGSNNSNFRKASKSGSIMRSRFSTILRPGIAGNPPKTTRAGSPPAWQSTHCRRLPDAPHPSNIVLLENFCIDAREYQVRELNAVRALVRARWCRPAVTSHIDRFLAFGGEEFWKSVCTCWHTKWCQRQFETTPGTTAALTSKVHGVFATKSPFDLTPPEPATASSTQAFRGLH